MNLCLRRWRIGIGVLVGVLATGGVLSRVAAENPPAAAKSAEKSKEFLQALRDRGYFDLALDYLEQMRTSPLASSEFKERIDYEAGRTLILHSATLRVRQEREKRLTEAEDCFTKFLAEKPHSLLAFRAKTQMANLLTERGKVKIEQVHLSKKNPKQKKQLLREARDRFAEARKIIGELEKIAAQRVKQYPKGVIDPKDAQTIAQRDQARTDYLLVRLSSAQVLYELAQTFSPGSKSHKKYLIQAADLFNEMYTKYGTRIAGMYARLQEGRSWRELGRFDKAETAFDDLLTLPDQSSALQRLKNRAAVQKLETLAAAKRYPQALAFYKEWKKVLRGADQSSEEGLTFKYRAGDAALEWARSIPEDDQEQAPLRRECRKQAREAFAFVARFPGEYQSPARIKLNDPLLSDKKTEGTSVPKDYFEARDRGKAAFDQLQIMEPDEDDAVRRRDEAIRCFRLALAMKPPDAPPEDVALIRSWLAYLYWLADDLYDAAVLGEFLATRYPDSALAQHSATIGLAAYARLYHEASKEVDKKLFARKMNAMAQWITRRWPDTAAADNAWMTLIQTAVLGREMEKATAYLQQIPAESPRRGEAELITGQALWRAYLEAARLPENQRPPQAQRDQLLAQAQKTLEAGLQRMRKDIEAGAELNYTLIASLLSLAQIDLDAGRAEKAIAWLTAPKIGPLTLCEANLPLTKRGSFRVETYKAALRAFVAVQNLEKAQQAMQSLEHHCGDANLTRIYIGLGRQLEESLKRLQEQGRHDEAAQVRCGFELFLTKISERPLAELNFNSLNWVAETFMGLGASLDPQDVKPPPEAENYYQKAAKTYKKILQICRKDENFAPAGAAVWAIQIRLSRCLRRLGEFEKALELLVDILKTNNNTLDAQVEAAYAYQAWGEVRPGYYRFAIQGGKPAETKQGQVKLVWGWGRISRRVQNLKQYRDTFFEARYNLALCRLKISQSQTGQQRKKTLQKAIRDVTMIYKLYPHLGGPEWFAKFDVLLKKIQRLANLPADGLKGKEKM